MKKTLLLLTLMVLLTPWALKASELTIYENATGTSDYVPVYGTWADAYLKCEFVVPADELSALNGGTISRMSFYLTSSAATAWTGTFQVFLQEVTDATISAYYGPDNATVVYEGTLDATGETMDVEFTTNYTYNGGNLLIGVYQTVSGIWKSATFAGAEVTGACVQGYSSSSLDGVSTTQRNFVPKMTFEYAPAGSGPICVKPKNLAVSLTPGSGSIAGLSWTAGGEETEWVIEYSTSSTFEEGNVVVNGVTDNPYILSGLTPETTYYARVKAHCGDENESGFTNPISFTPTDAYIVTVNDGTATNGYVPIYGYYVDNISKSQFIIPAADLASVQWGTIDKLTFYSSTAAAAWTGAEFEVYMAEASETTLSALADYASMTKVMDAAHLEISGNKLVVTLDAPYQYMGGNLMIGFLQTVSGTYSSASFYGVTATGASLGGYGSSVGQQNFLPKVTFDYTPGQAPSCAPVSSLSYSDLAARSVKLSWNLNDDSQTAWQICLNDDENNLIAADSHQDFLLEGLTPETEYSVKVRPDCGGDWSNAISFTTIPSCFAPTNLVASDIKAHSANLAWDGDAESFNVSYRKAGLTNVLFFEGFEDGTEFADWQAFGIVTTNTGEKFGRLATAKRSGDYGFSFSSFTSATDYNQYLISPELTVGGVLQFYYKASNSSETFRVGYSSTGSDVADFTWGDAINATSSWTAFNEVIPAGTKFFAINYFSDYKYQLFIDDIAIGATAEWSSVVSGEASTVLTGLDSETDYDVKVQANCGDVDGLSAESATIQFTTGIACLAPTALAYSDLGSSSVKLNWTENGDAQEWQICVNDNMAGLITVLVTDTPYVLSGLVPETDYSIKVRANCGSEDGESIWSNVVTFTTLATCPVPSELRISKDLSHSVVLAWTADNDSYNIRYRKVAAIETPIFSEGFENGIGDWTLRDCDDQSGVSSDANHSGSFGFKFRYNSNPPQYLISPELSGVAAGMKLEFYYKNSSSSWPETFHIGFSSTDNETASFEFGDEITASDQQWHLYSVEVPAGTKFICWKLTSNNKLNLYIDDIIVGAAVDKPWNNLSGNEKSIKLSGLDEKGNYEAQVQGVCGENATEWSDLFYFTTRESQYVVIVGSRHATYYNELAYTMPNGLEGYTFEADLHLHKVFEAGDVVPVETPLVLKATAPNTYELAPTDEESTVIYDDQANLLEGVLTPTYVAHEAGKLFYVLSLAKPVGESEPDPSTVGFYWYNADGSGGFTVPATKAYLKLDASVANNAPGFIFDENGATSLDNLKGVDGALKFIQDGNIYILREGVIYDATGRKVRTL